MSRRSDDNKDVLSKIHEQIVKDQNNDSTQTGSFPVAGASEADFAEREGCSCPPVLQRACNRALRVARLSYCHSVEQHNVHI